MYNSMSLQLLLAAHESPANDALFALTRARLSPLWPERTTHCTRVFHAETVCLSANTCVTKPDAVMSQGGAVARLV
jgi:hypothetical protein